MKSRMGKVATVKPERKSSKLGNEILALVCFTTLIITPSLTIDAFNPPKFAILISGVTYIGIRYWKIIIQGLAQKATLLPYISLLIIFLITLIANTYSISERLFGIEGRNFGFLTLVALSLIGLYSLQATKRNLINAENILNGLGLTNFGVCLIFFLQENKIISTDFNNVYTTLPSTLGNPNFLSAYLGISILGLMNWMFQNRYRPLLALLGFGVNAYSIFIIVISGSIQGIVALAISLIALALIVCLRFLSKILNLLIFTFVGITTLIVASGFLSYGPLGTQLSQSTIRNRIIYWEIATRMFQESPLLGSGYDSYLDNYRIYVRESDFEKLGGPIVSNSPHNIFLELFVSGGLFLGLSFLFITLFTIFKGFTPIKKSLESRDLDISVASLYSIFLALVAICLISPFQIGLFVWLPLLIGALLGINSIRYSNEKQNLIMSQEVLNKAASVTLCASLSLTNLVFAVLPISTEIRFRVAVEEGSFTKLEKVALDWPFSAPRAISIAQGFLDARFNVTTDVDNLAQLEVLRQRAFEIALATIQINNRQIDGWRFLLRNSPDSVAKEKARQKLHELDPINPEYKLSP